MITSTSIDHLLKMYGNTCLSYSTLQPNMCHYKNNSGYIAYMADSKMAFPGYTYKAVLGEPVTLESASENLLNNFLSVSKDAFFVQIYEKTASFLNSKGYTSLPLGYEYIVVSDDYRPSWKYQSLKRGINKAKRCNYQFFEGNMSCSKFYNQLQVLLKVWKKKFSYSLSTHGFLNRPFLLTPEPDVRYFYMLKDKRMVSCVRCDPIYSCYNIIGYSVSYILYDPEIKGNFCLPVFDYAFQMLFQDVHVKNISLGIVPFDYISFKSFFYFKFLSSFLNMFYNFSNLSTFKSSFPHKKVMTYISINNRLPFFEFLLVYLLTTGLYEDHGI